MRLLFYIISAVLTCSVSTVPRVSPRSSVFRPPYVSGSGLLGRSAAASSDEKQNLVCYETDRLGGEKIAADDYVADLGRVGFNDRVSSCCFTGVWILYEHANYDSGGMVWWGYGNNFCRAAPAQFADSASSLRFSGAPDGLSYDTLNLYFDEYFGGGEEFTYNDAPVLNYDNRARSVIVTGCSAWTLYTGDNYQGSSTCVFPADTENCLPGFYSTELSLGHLAGRVSSARKGCDWGRMGGRMGGRMAGGRMAASRSARTGQKSQGVVGFHSNEK